MRVEARMCGNPGVCGTVPVHARPLIRRSEVLKILLTERGLCLSGAAGERQTVKEGGKSLKSSDPFLSREAEPCTKGHVL